MGALDCLHDFTMYIYIIDFTIYSEDNSKPKDFKPMNSSVIVYSYLPTPIGKPFLLNIFLFCFVTSRLSPSVIIFSSYP